MSGVREMEYMSMEGVMIRSRMMVSMRECLTRDRDCTKVWEMVGSMRYRLVEVYELSRIWEVCRGMVGSMKSGVRECVTESRMRE